jgi:Icc-related predicted phosphoesterase
MRICFTSDLHGRAELFEQLDRLLRSERPDLAILGGDMFPDGDLDDPLGTQTAYVERFFLPLVRGWRQAMPQLAVAMILGNHDWACTEDSLRVCHERGELVLLSHEQVWTHDGVSFLGYSPTPPTPHWVKDFERLDLPEDPIPETGGAVWDRQKRCVRQALPSEHFRSTAALSEDLAQAAVVSGPWMFVCHAPPFGSGLDRLPHVDYPVGSRATRAFIEQRQPMCALHGHIHESPDVTGQFTHEIGAALCVNPGQGPRLKAVLFEAGDPRGTLRHTVYA